MNHGFLPTHPNPFQSPGAHGQSNKRTSLPFERISFQVPRGCTGIGPGQHHTTRRSGPWRHKLEVQNFPYHEERSPKYPPMPEVTVNSSTCADIGGQMNEPRLTGPKVITSPDRDALTHPSLVGLHQEKRHSSIPKTRGVSNPSPRTGPTARSGNS